MRVYKITSAIARWIWQLKNLPYLRHMKVQFKDDGSTIEVPDYKTMVSRMRELSWDDGLSDQEYMKEYARRAVIQSNEDIRATSVEEFVSDLVRLGHVNVLVP